MIGYLAAGRAMMAAAAPGHKQLVMELCGKDPLLVFGDTELEAAAQMAMDFSVMNTGLICAI